MPTVTRPERLGVFGGTFDPPHIGHTTAAVKVRAALGLDRVLLVVANDPWQKRDLRAISPAADRLAMVRLATAGLEGIEADDREIRRSGLSYTADTLAELKAEGPDRALFLVVGGDAAAGLETWERPDEIGDLATIAVVDRGGPEAHPFPGGDFRWVLVDDLIPDVSSTAIRARVGSGGSTAGLVDEGVASLIGERRLYSLAR
jgi:nicotinate-nucleotide adenylyltransferase